MEWRALTSFIDCQIPRQSGFKLLTASSKCPSTPDRLLNLYLSILQSTYFLLLPEDSAREKGKYSELKCQRFSLHDARVHPAAASFSTTLTLRNYFSLRDRFCCQFLFFPDGLKNFRTTGANRSMTFSRKSYFKLSG